MRVSARDVAELWGLAGATRRSRGRSMRSGAGASRRRSSPRSPACGRSGSTPAARSSCPRACSPPFRAARAGAGSGRGAGFVALAADDLRAGRAGEALTQPARRRGRAPPRCGAREQAHRVHLLELAEKDHPRAFNPIELDGADPELVAAQFVDTMSDLYFSGLASPRPYAAAVPALGPDDPSAAARTPRASRGRSSRSTGCSSTRSSAKKSSTV